MNFPLVKYALPFILALACMPVVAQAPSGNQRTSWLEGWRNMTRSTQAAQPHWMTPLATSTARLRQSFRFDTLHQQAATGNVTNLGGGKGLEFIPTRNTELRISPPPYMLHENPAVPDGWGDVAFRLKYRLLSRNEQHGAAIVSAFLSASVPTGTHGNGSSSAVLTPTLAGGKSWGRFDIQATLAGTLPVDDADRLGHSVTSNTAFQYHVRKRIWPELEINSTFWSGGKNDGKTQTFLTPGVMLGGFRVNHHQSISAGAGFQIAVTSFHKYDHAFIGSVRFSY